MSRSQQLRPRVRLPVGSDVLDHGCSILHVDIDAFFAAVEVRDRPELVGRPVIVGAGRRGVVLSATYEARAFGVYSAMPLGRALRMCPRAIVVPPRPSEYAEVSSGVFDIFESFTPMIEPRSLDEAFLDVAGARRTGGRPSQIGAAIRRRVAAEQGITCSVGVAATKSIAKIASTLVKPDGLLVVPPERVLEFLHPLPATTLWGVGDRAAAALRAAGIRTVGDLAAAPRRLLEQVVGATSAAHLVALAGGRDDRPVMSDRVEQSIGADNTFDTDTTDLDVLRRELRHLSERVAVRLRRDRVAARTLTIRIRRADFSAMTRSRTLANPTSGGYEVFRLVDELLTTVLPLGQPVRLLGVRAQGLVPAGRVTRQLGFGERPVGWAELDQVTDRATARFGEGSVRPARLVGRHT